MARVTGTVIDVPRKDGVVLYIKARDRNGKQIKKKLGPLYEGRGKAPEGHWTRKDAAEALRDFLTDLGRAPDVAAVGVTVAAARDAWLAYVQHDKGRTASTVADYRSASRRYLVEKLGAETPIGDVSTDSIEDLRSELLEEVSRRTTQKALVLLHGMLEYAKRRRWIDVNPAEDVERVRLKRTTEFAVLSPAEVDAVSRAATGQVAAAIIVSAYTGLRLGELRGLRWRDVDFANALVHVRRAYWRSVEGTPKSGKARSVPLIDQAAKALDALSRRERFTAAGDYVFPSATGTMIHDSVMRKGLYAAMTAAGVDRDRGTGDLFRWHDLRHTFGTLAVRVFPLSDVKAYMGHANIDTTMRYVHHVPQHDAARKLSALIEEGTSAALGDLEKISSLAQE